MSKTSRIILGYGLLVLALLFAYTLYKLADLGWFANATIPTLLFYSFFALVIVLGLYHAVANFIKTNKETK